MPGGRAFFQSHGGPVLHRAGGAPAFAVEGDEPELIETSGGEGDGGGNDDGGAAGGGGGEQLGHGAGADAPRFEPRGSGRESGGGEGAGGCIPSGVGGGGGHLLGCVAQDVHVPQGVDAGRGAAPIHHPLADERVKRVGRSHAEGFLGEPGIFQGSFGIGLGRSQSAGGVAEGGDGGAEGGGGGFTGKLSHW